jgi:hypothetical protein
MDYTLIKKEKNVFIPAFLVIITLQPYFIWGIARYSNILSGIIMLFVALSYAKFTILNTRIAFFFVICNLYYFFGGTTYTTFSPVFFLPLFFLVLSNDYKMRIFEKFIKIISIIFVLGFITYTLRFFISIPGVSMAPLNSLKEITYTVYLFDITLPQAVFPKFMSIFDEPGVVGTLCALLISYKKINVKSISTIAILLAGIFSFSLAFYTILILNLLFNFNKRYALLFVFMLIIFSFLPKENIINTYIIDRLQFVDGGISGDNRTSTSFTYNYEDFIKKGGDDLLFGRGMGAEGFDDADNLGSSSYKVLIYRHGLIGVGLFLLFFIYITWALAPTIRGWFFLTVFVLLAYQRINIFIYYNIVIYIGGLLVITHNSLILKSTNSYLKSK